MLWKKEVTQKQDQKLLIAGGETKYQLVESVALSTVYYCEDFILYQCLERFPVDCRKAKTKPVTYQLDCSANLKH